MTFYFAPSIDAPEESCMAILRTDATMNSDLEAQDNTKVGEVTENEDTPDETSGN